MNQQEMSGPCYDFCACSFCWNGWKQLSFPRRLYHRILHILGRE